MSPEALNDKSSICSNTPTLEQFAAAINQELRQADYSRLAAGRLLLQAREIFEATKAEGDSWRAWCASNIPGRSYRDIKRVMALARSADPVAAVASEREANRARKAAGRAAEHARGTEVRPPADNVVTLNPSSADTEEQSGDDDGDMPSQPEIIPARNSESDNPENVPEASGFPEGERRGPRIQRGKNNKVKTKPEFALDIVKHFTEQFE
jgi:hypothetical protein